MKRILKIAALVLLMVTGGSLTNNASAQYDQYDQDDGDYDQDREVSYQTFYDELSPHGRWVDYPGQGYVWVPNAGPDFRPYSTNGHWVWSENFEWVWVSDYDWGWAPFHYGRWDNDPYYGWYWVPGYEWSGAWVAWRDGGDYYGWAPIRPGISISINFNIGGYAPPVDFWCFAPRRYISSPRIYDYYVDRRRNVTIINQTTIIVNNYHYGNNYGFRTGPRRYDAELYCGRINPVRFRQSYTPGRTTFRNNEVSMFRPNVRRDNNNNNRFAPRSVERYDRNNAQGGFRNNDVVRNNGNNNGRFDRRDNTPDNRDRVGGRENRDIRQPGNTDNRRFDRNNNPDQPNRNNDRRVMNPSDRPERNNNPGNNGNPNRRFERPDVNQGNNGNNGNTPGPRRFEGNNGNPQPRQMDRRQDQPQPQRQFERREQPQQQPQRQIERRQEQPQQRQIERRQEPRQQQQPQPQRQIERRDNGGGNNGGGGGNGRGNRRF